MEPQNCWEFRNCPKEKRDKCPAYTTNSGKECFYLTKDMRPRFKKEFRHCWECPCYKKINSDFDEGEE